MPIATRLSLRSLLATALALFSIGGAIGAEPSTARQSCLTISEIRSVSTESSQLKDYNDCGLRSLALVMDLRDHHSSEDDLRAMLPVGPLGVSMAEIQAATLRLGIPHRVVQCAPPDLDHLSLPAIAQLEPSALTGLNHFIVLFQINATTVDVCDPSVGTVHRIPRLQFSQETTGYFRPGS